MVHETWQLEGKIGELEGGIAHYPHQSIDEFLKEVNFYTTLRAEELFDQKVRVVFWHIAAYPIAKLFKNFVLKLGFLDGIEGIIFATMMSFHSFLVRGKLWLLWQKK